MLTKRVSRALIVFAVAVCVAPSQARARQSPPQQSTPSQSTPTQSSPQQSPPPQPKSAATQAADSLFASKRWAEAAKAYEEVTRAEPSNAQAWFNYAVSLYSLDRFTEAAAVFEKAGEAGKGTPLRRLSLYNVAASYARAGEKAKALDSLERIVAVNPLFGIGVAADSDFETLRAEPRFKEFTLAVDKAQKPCMYEAGYRQFDFFMGDWDVFSQGRKVGESHTKVLQNGCIIEENWQTPFQTAQSFNFYNPVTKRWHQSYMDSTGGNWMMDGEYREGALRYEGYIYSPQGRTLVRMTFYNLEPGRLQQTAETSSDGGKTWVQGWDGLYIRRKSEAVDK